MAAREVPRAVRLAGVVGGAGLLAFVIHTLLPDAGDVAWWFDYLVYYGLVALAVALTLARAALVPVHRAGWTTIAAGVLAYGAGEFVYQFHVLPSGGAYPSIADVLYLAFYPCSYVGLITLFRARARAATPALWIDGLTAGLAAAALGSAVLVEAVLESTEGPFAVVATNLAYPVADVVLLSFVLAAFALTGWRPGRVWVLIGLALAVFAAADAVYLYATATGSYREGTPLDVGWPAALLFIAFAAWQDDGRARPIDARGRTFLALPAAGAAVALSVLVIDHFQRVNLAALTLSTLALGAVVARLALSFRENRRLLELTHHESLTDPLTGLGNRRRLLRDLERALAEATLERPWLLAIFDLDGFKAYNDLFGHPAGDELLARLGSKLAAAAGGSCVYRLGGDEFCLLAPADTAGAGALVDRALAALEEEGEAFSVSSSFGAVFLPHDAVDASNALREADARLYAQKHTRRARRDRPHEALLQALFERDPALQPHVEDVARLAISVGRDLGLREAELDLLARAAQLHDIGKIAVPDAILAKRGPLGDDDWRFVRKHTLIGERILGASPSLRAVGPIVRATHERWDGGGYPDGLAGEEIPLAARVIAACDAYAAMTSPRPYREARSPEAAIAELRRCAGTQFDPGVVARLTRVLAEGAPLAHAG